MRLSSTPFALKSFWCESPQTLIKPVRPCKTSQPARNTTKTPCKITPLSQITDSKDSRKNRGSGKRYYSYFSVATGSSRAARCAGSVPKATPTSTEVASAITALQGEIGILMLVNMRRLSGSASPMMRPDKAARERHEDGLGEELHSYLTPRGAESLADADLLDARLHVRQHGVHDAHAGDDERDAPRPASARW